MDDAKAVGARLRTVRKAARLSQSDVADLAGISERTLRNIEAGTGTPSFRAVAAVANVLGLHVEVN